MVARRPRLAARRKSLGYTQEFLAEKLEVDRTTIGRWERGETDPFPYLQGKLCRILQVPPEELVILLAFEASTGVETGPPESDFPRSELLETADDMYRRELLRLLSIAGVAMSIPAVGAGELPPSGRATSLTDLKKHARLNQHLWQVFALATSKRDAYPFVQDHLGVLVADLKGSQPGPVHQELCVLVCDVFQLSGEIAFDGGDYANAFHCYALAASVAREARSYDRWACALTREAFVHIYDGQYAQAADVLDAAGRVARDGDSELPTRQWVAVVQAQALAGLGDLSGCRRALETAEDVQAFPGLSVPGGWLRFDGTRLGEERGACYMALGQTDLAEYELASALDGIASLRRRGSVLADLAMLGIEHKDISQVLHYAGDAVDIAEQTRSAGYLGRKLTGLQERIQPLLGDTRMADLNDRLSRLPSAT